MLLLGTQFVAKVAALIVLARIDEKPRELMVTAMVRARMCELLGAALGEPAATCFIVGLFSTLDALLDLPIAQALAPLPLAESVTGALTSRSGTLGAVLGCVLDYERGEWAAVSGLGLEARAVQDSYLQAIAWARETMSHL